MTEATIKTAAILATGDEILQGRTVDTNSSHIADRLGAVGVETVLFAAVGDYTDRIEDIWRFGLERADLVISTGGLGPTADDLTNETLAHLAGVDLVRDENEADRIRAMFRDRGREMPENNLKQADLPQGAVVVPNELGTAPGYRLVIPTAGRRPVGIVLPGVPREMYRMLEDSVIPWVAARSEDGVLTRAVVFQTFGLPESALDQLLQGSVDPAEGRLAFRASFPKIAVRVSATGAEGEVDERLARLAQVVRERLGDAIYAEGEAGMEEVVGSLLTESGLTLATAESCTGGLIGNRLTDVAGSSAYYRGGLVAYSNDLKQDALDVASSTLRAHGAVSEETAREMALGVCRRTKADLGIATTGIAGPDGGTADKPVGTVAVALAVRHGDDWTAESRMFRFPGTREWVKVLTSQIALDWVRRHLLGLAPLDTEMNIQRGRKSA